MATTEIAVSGADAATLAHRDFNFFAALVSPDEFTYRFPDFYLALFDLLTTFNNKVDRYAIGIPRGFAKTTYIKLLCIWYIIYSDRRFILLVGATEKMATNTMADIFDMLSSPNIQRLFGSWQYQCEEDTKEQKVFTFRGRTIVVKAIGAGTAVRGINRKSSRPDVIIMDDVQKREDSENAELSDQLLRWILGTLMKARSNSGCSYIYVGNMYPQNCILAKLKDNSQWTSLIVGGLLADGSSLWEELRPAEELIGEYESDRQMGHAEIFISEILNSTDVALASGIDIGKIPQLPDYYVAALAAGEAEGGFILIDPSSGKKQGDDCTISHYSVVDGKAILDSIHAGTFSPLETIEHAIKLGVDKGTRLIAVEDVAYQSTLLFWFNHYCNESGISGFEFVAVAPKGQAKNNRIKRGLLRLLAGEIYLHPDTRSLVLSQITEWNPLKVNNTDDIIDPIGYVEEVMNTYPELIIRQTYDVDTFAGTASHSGSLALPY